jgi:hypothetical protein
MAVPVKDSDLAAWTTNFSTRISATPVPFGLTAAQATAYATLSTAFISAYDAANTEGARSRSLVAAKNSAKLALVNGTGGARELYGFVQDNKSVTDANKELLNVRVRKVEPTPVPPPADKPGIVLLQASGRTLRVRLFDPATPTRRAKPFGVNGASVFSFVGLTPPVDITAWKFEGNTAKTTVNVTFPDTVANWSTVWLTAFWFNPRKQSGPATDPVSFALPGGGVSMAA